MPERVVNAEIGYRLEYVPQGARKPRAVWVTERVPVSVPQIAAGRAPVAFVATAGSGRLWGAPAGQPRTARREAGRFLAAAVGADGLIFPPAGQDVGTRAAWTGTAYPFPHDPPTPGWTVMPFEGLRVREIVSSDRERAVAKAQEAGRRLAFIDGALHVPVLRPVWRVERLPERIEIDLIEPPRRYEDWGPLFDTGDLDAAEAHAGRLLSDPAPGSNDPVEGVEIERAGTVDILRPDLVPLWTLSLARGALAPFRAQTWGHDFAQLSPEALKEWVRYRAALPEALATGPDAGAAAREALVALCDLAGALPPYGDGIPASARALHEGLHETVRWATAYLFRSAPARKAGPVVTEDAEALSGLAP